MNKKLRRLLKRRQTSSDRSEPEQRTNNKQPLSSLFSQHPSVKPNHYFRSNCHKQNDLNDLKDEHEKSDKTILLVENAGLSVLEKQASKLEINFEPMENDPDKTGKLSGEDDSFEFEESPRINDEVYSESKSHVFSATVNQAGEKEALQRQERAENNIDLSAAVLIQSGNSHFFLNQLKNIDTHATFRRKNDVSKCRNDNSKNLPLIGVSKSADQGKSDCQASVTRNSVQNSNNNQHCVFLQSGFSGGCNCNPVLSCNCLKSFNAKDHIKLLPVHSCASLGVSGVSAKNLPCHFVQGDFEFFPSTGIRFSRNSNQIPSSTTKSKQTSPTCLQCQNCQAQLSNRHCLEGENNSNSFLSQHQNRFTTSFDVKENHSFRHQIQRLNCSHNCYVDSQQNKDSSAAWTSVSTRSCSSSCQKKLSSKTSPFISVCISGEDQTRIIQLPFLENDPFFESDFQCNEEPFFQASIRHLEDSHSNCLKDCKLRSGADNMAPSLVFLPNLQELNTLTSETHCPCCCRIIREKKQFHHSGATAVACSIHPALHHYNNTETNQAKVPKSFGHFTISPKSYAKLLNFIESKKVAMRKRPSRFNGEQNPNFPENLSFDNELQFVTRKPHIRAYNEYANFGDQFNAAKAYHNQAVGEMVLLAKVLETVEECPWYWGEVSNVEAKAILQGSAIGTFLLRDSSDPRYLFSVSVMTSRGPTSIRIVYSNGSFRFDSDGEDSRVPRRELNSNELSEIPPHRRCVVRMILHYTNHISSSKSNQTTKTCSETDSKATSPPGDDNNVNDMNTNSVSKKNERGQFMCSWMGRSGKKVMPVQIEEPQPINFLSLQKLSRACISKHLKLWKNLDKVNNLPLPGPLQTYLTKYPYPI